MASIIEAVLKIYPTHVTLYIPKFSPSLFTIKQKKQLKFHYDTPQDYLQKSIDRTHSKIRDYILCNDFKWFFTLTISPLNCDRSDDVAVQRLLKSYFDTLRRTQAIQYLLVPERHKTGELHFHGLVTEPPLLLPTGKKDTSGRPRYQSPLASLTMGFNDFTEIDNTEAVAQYVRKYITKSLITDKNKKRYYCSRNLKTPDVQYIDPRQLPVELWEQMYDLDYAYFGSFGI